MRKVFETMLDCMEKGENTVLTTIIEDKGSVPRGKGSVMLIGTKGCLAGSIGGGAVEAESVRNGFLCLQNKRSETKEYNLSLQEETLGMACGGEVRVNFQYVDAKSELWKNTAKEIIGRINEGKSGQLLLKTRDNPEPEPVCLVNCPLDMENLTMQENTVAVSYTGEERVIIFGAGHIGAALTPLLKSVGFRVTVMDDRPEYVTRERFPLASELICDSFQKAAQRANFAEDDYVVIMTSGHLHDFEVEEQVLRFDTAYVGVVGSKKKIKTVNEKLRNAGICEEKIAGIHTPIGISIKSVTPEEIAVSIAAEMILVRAERRENKAKQINY